MIQVGSLHIFPIKSLRGFSPERWEVERRGLKHDRRWMLVDENGLFLTQRKIAKMALFDVEPMAGGLRVGLQGHAPIELPFEANGARRWVRVWGSRVAADLVCAEADAWFSDKLKLPCSLVRMPESSRRSAKAANARASDIVGFADSNPILVAGTASLGDLNQRLVKPLPIIRFRANIVVSGAQPFEEDEWPSFKIGDVALRRTKKCGRCIVTTIDIETGKSSDEPLRTLATFRKDGKNVCFGTYFAPDSLGEIGVGDVVNPR